MGIVPENILYATASNAVARSQGQADNAAHFQDRLDDLLELIYRRWEGCATNDYQSIEMVTWLNAKREAYGYVIDDIRLKGGVTRTERRKQREQAK